MQTAQLVSSACSFHTVQPPLSLSQTISLNPSPRIKISCSLGSLFDLRIAKALRKEQGEDAFNAYMLKNAGRHFLPGPAFPFVSKLLGLNRPNDIVVEVNIHSKLSNATLSRVERSLLAAGSGHGVLPLNKQITYNCLGQQSYKQHLYDDMGQDLILTTTPQDVQTAIAHGLPAAYIHRDHIPTGQDQSDIHIALDFDRCAALACPPPEHEDRLIDCEEVTACRGLEAAHAQEKAFGHQPAHAGPLAPLLIKYCQLSKRFCGDITRPSLFFHLVTARTDKSLRRVETTLKAWDCVPDHLYSTGYDSKGKIIANIGADAFFDDSPKHIEDVREKSPRTVAGQTVYDPRFAQVATSHYG